MFIISEKFCPIHGTLVESKKIIRGIFFKKLINKWDKSANLVKKQCVYTYLCLTKVKLEL